MKHQNPFVNFLIWRSKYLGSHNFLLILSVVIGVLAALASSLLKFLVEEMQHFIFFLVSQFSALWLLWVFPLLGLLLTAIYVRFFNRDKLGHGIPNILYDIAKRAGIVHADKMYSHIASSVFTIGFGGSAGLEAPIVTTGSAIGSNSGRLFHLNHRKRMLLIGCGAAAATSAIFNAPISGVVFVMEILLLELAATSFIPILLASVTGAIVAALLGTSEVMITYGYSYDLVMREIPLFVGLGIITGLMSVVFTRSVYWFDNAFKQIKHRIPRALYAGLALGMFIFLMPVLFGEGFETIRKVLTGAAGTIYDESQISFVGDEVWMIIIFWIMLIFIKIIAASLTMAGGGNAGIFAPCLFIGCLTGYVFAFLLNGVGLPFEVQETAFALVAMAGLMSGVMHAPLTGIFLIAEITFGHTLIIPLMIVSAISFLTVKIFDRHSIYTKQLAEKGWLLAGNPDRQVLANMRIKRVIEMDLATIHPKATLGDLVEVVKHSTRNIFPVVDEHQHLHGIILLDDIREIMFKPKLYEETGVSQLMHAPPAYVYDNEDMEEIMEKFNNTGAWNLPVLQDEKYIGFLSKSKIFNIYRKMLLERAQE